MAGRPWTQEETQFIIDRNSAGIYHTDIAAEFGTKFGYSRSPDALRKRLVRMGVQIAPYQETPSEAAVALSRGKSQPRFKPTQPKLTRYSLFDADIKQMFRVAGLKKTDIYRLVVEPDVHAPYHDPYAVNAFNKFVDWYKPHGLVIIGDYGEWEAVSHWPKQQPDPRLLVPEVKSCNHELDETLSAAGNQLKFKRFLKGNHEFWVEQYLNSRIPEAVYGLEELGIDLSVKKLLRLKERGFRTVPVNGCLRVGYSHFIHGYYTSKYHAAKHLEVWRCNIYYGHTHDVQQHAVSSVYGLHEAQSLGCLRDLNAAFLNGKPNNWSHALGVFEFRYDGSYTVTVPKMIDAKFSYAGVLFEG